MDIWHGLVVFIKMARKVKKKSQIKHESKYDILISNHCSEHF